RLILIGGARGDFGRELTVMLLADSSELTERGEEMVVAGFGAGDEIAHGEAVDQRVAQRIVGFDGRGIGASIAAARAVHLGPWAAGRWLACADRRRDCRPRLHE